MTWKDNPTAAPADKEGPKDPRQEAFINAVFAGATPEILEQAKTVNFAYKRMIAAQDHAEDVIAEKEYSESVFKREDRIYKRMINAHFAAPSPEGQAGE